MNELSIWLDAHCPRGDMGVFRSAAELHDASTTDTIEAVSDGLELLALLRTQPTSHYDHVVIAGHGGTTWILDDEHGVTTLETRHSDQISIVDLGRELARVMRGPIPLISLAACLCSRSPTWILRRLVKLGRLRQIGSDWGRRAYLPGGLQSFSGWLRDACALHGQPVRVRGHRASGHATALALLAEHSGEVGSPCTTLYRECWPDRNPTLTERRWWTSHVTGLLAQRWLMGDDRVVEEIRELRDPDDEYSSHSGIRRARNEL